jgi:hypothetical protein
MDQERSKEGVFLVVSYFGNTDWMDLNHYTYVNRVDCNSTIAFLLLRLDLLDGTIINFVHAVICELAYSIHFLNILSVLTVRPKL